MNARQLLSGESMGIKCNRCAELQAEIDLGAHERHDLRLRIAELEETLDDWRNERRFE